MRKLKTIHDGQRFGKFIVLQTIDSSKCLCQCDCGNVRETWTQHLKNGKSTSCGCSRMSSGSPTWKGYQEIPLTFFNRIKRKATERNRNYCFNITIEYLWELYLKQDKKCALTNIPMRFPESSEDMVKRVNISLDRIDNTKGYTTENVQWVVPDVNLMKNRLCDDTFYKMCRLVTSPLHIDYSECILDKQLSSNFYYTLCSGAKQRNIKVEISKEDIFKKYLEQKARCYYTGLHIVINSRSFFDETPVASVDRIDSNRHYTNDNICLVHKTINLMKNTLDDSKFRDYCQKIIENRRC